MRKRRKRKHLKQETSVNSVTMMGAIIDLDLEDFKKELEKQKVNVGVANNLRLHLIGEYERCKAIVNDLQTSILKGILKEDDPEVQKAYVGTYVQMQKIEDKVNAIVQYVQHLSEGLENTFDTLKH